MQDTSKRQFSKTYRGKHQVDFPVEISRASLSYLSVITKIHKHIEDVGRGKERHLCNFCSKFINRMKF